MNIFLDHKNKIFLFYGVVLFFLVLREAILIPLTHDEYSTIMVSYQSFWDIVTYKDPIPNNHILNTLLLKLNILTFGNQLFTNRLHNVLSFIPYFIFSVYLARRISSDILLQITLLSMLTLQPFLLDFFSVTRGYCLSLCLQVISLYYAVAYLQESKSKHFILSLCFGALSVIANFTLLNYFFPLSSILIYLSFKNNFKTNHKKFKNEAGWFCIIGLLLASVCYLPFSKMVKTNQFSYWQSNNFFKDTVAPLFNSLKSGVSYFNWNESTYAMVFIILVSTLFMITLVFSRMSLLKNKIFQFSVFILFLTIFYNNLQFYLVNIPFLNARTSLFFIPLVGLFIFSIVNYLYITHIKAGKTIAIVLIIICGQHFLRGYNGRVNFEWYFNQNTYEVLDELMYEINSKNLQKPVLLDCHWFYHPSLTFHINQKYRGIIELVPYHKETNPNSDANFYYSEPQEVDSLAQKFNKIKEFSGTYSVLWQKRENLISQ